MLTWSRRRIVLRGCRARGARAGDLVAVFIPEVTVGDGFLDPRARWNAAAMSVWRCRGAAAGGFLLRRARRFLSPMLPARRTPICGCACSPSGSGWGISRPTSSMTRAGSPSATSCASAILRQVAARPTTAHSRAHLPAGAATLKAMVTSVLTLAGAPVHRHRLVGLRACEAARMPGGSGGVRGRAPQLTPPRMIQSPGWSLPTRPTPWALALGAILLATLLLGPRCGRVWSWPMTWGRPTPADAFVTGSARWSPPAVPSDALAVALRRWWARVQRRRPCCWASSYRRGRSACFVRYTRVGVGGLPRRWGRRDLESFVAERLAIGQWTILLGYAVLGWLAAAARVCASAGCRSCRSRPGSPLAGMGGANTIAMALPVALVGSCCGRAPLRWDHQGPSGPRVAPRAGGGDGVGGCPWA